jgi:uncharacterized membrane protein YraQ (UPF0718 family)
MKDLLKKNKSFYFLGGVILLYAILLVFDHKRASQAVLSSLEIMVNIAPVLLLVILFTALIKYFLSPKAIGKYVGRDSGLKGWFLAIAAGILSHGPVYVWYTMLQELREQGMSSGLIAVFLYNRSVKIPLLPVMISLFGLKFVLLLFFYMVAASVVQGTIMKRIFD